MVPDNFDSLSNATEVMLKCTLGLLCYLRAPLRYLHTPLRYLRTRFAWEYVLIFVTCALPAYSFALPAYSSVPVSLGNVYSCS